MNLTSTETSKVFIPDAVPGGTNQPPVAEKDVSIFIKPDQGETQHPIIRELRKRYGEFLKDNFSEKRVADRKFEPFLTLEADSKDSSFSDFQGYQDAAKEVMESLEEQLNSKEGLNPKVLAEILKFGFEHLMFSKDDEIKMAAFVDLNIIFDSFNRKLIELSDKNGCMDSMNSHEGRQKVLTLMFSQGMLFHFIENVAYGVKDSNGNISVVRGKDVLKGFVDTQKKNKQNFNETIAKLFARTRETKIEVGNIVGFDTSTGRFVRSFLNRTLRFKEKYERDGSRDVPTSLSYEDLEKLRFMDIYKTEGGGLFEANYLDMHLHIANNEITRKDFEIIRSGNKETNDEEKEAVDQELLREENYYIDEDLDSFRRMTEFVGFNATHGRSLTLKTCLHFTFTDQRAVETILKYTLEARSGDDNDQKQLRLKEYLSFFQQTFVDAETGLLKEKGEPFSDNSGNFLRTVYESYGLLQRNKKAKVVLTQVAVGMFNRDARYRYYIPEVTSYDQMGGEARTKIDRFAAAKYRQYLAAALVGPLPNTDKDGNPYKYNPEISQQVNINGREYNIGAQLNEYKFRDPSTGMERVVKFRNSNLTYRLHNLVIARVKPTSGPIMTNVAYLPASLLNPTNRIARGLEPYLTAKLGPDGTHQGFLMGTYTGKRTIYDISSLTLEDIEKKDILQRLYRSPSDGGAVDGNVYVAGITDYIKFCTSFRDIYDRAGLLWPSGSNKDDISEPDVRYVFREATTDLTRLIGVHRNELPFVFGPKAEKDWDKVATKIETILGKWIGMYTSREKAPITEVLSGLLYEAVRTYRESVSSNETKNLDAEVDTKDAFMSKLSKTVDVIAGDPALMGEMSILFGDRKRDTIEDINGLPEIDKKVATFEIFFLNRFFHKRVALPMGKNNPGYLSLNDGTRLEQVTLSAAEVWGYSHLMDNSSLLEVGKSANTVGLLKETAEVLTANKIRFFAERFSEKRDDIRFVIDPEYVMAKEFGTTISRKGIDYNALNTELIGIIDKGKRFHVDPFTTYRIIYELNKLIKAETNINERERLSNIAKQWITHLNGINVSPMHSSRVLRNGLFTEESRGRIIHRPEKITIEESLEFAFRGKTSASTIFLWTETQLNSITLQIASMLGITKGYLDYGSIASVIQELQRTSIGITTFLTKVTNRNNRYNLTKIEDNGYTTFRKHFYSLLGRRGENPRERAFLFEGKQYPQNGDNSENLMDMARDMHSLVKDINQGLRLYSEKERDIERKLENYEPLTSDEISLTRSLEKARGLIEKYPDIFTLEKVFNKNENSTSWEVRIILPTHQIDPIFYVISELGKDSNAFANLVSIIDANSEQLGGKQTISLAGMIFYVFGSISRVRFNAEVNQKSEGGISPLRALSKFIEEAEKLTEGTSVPADAERQLDFVLKQRLGLSKEDFYKEGLSLLGITRGSLIEEIEKWQLLQARGNKPLEGAVTAAAEALGGNLPLGKAAKPVLNALNFVVGKTLWPFSNPLQFRTMTTVLATGGIVATGVTLTQLLSSGLSLSTAGVTFTWPLAAGLYLGSSLIGRYVSNCVRKYALYGNKIPSSIGKVETIFVNWGNTVLKNLPIPYFNNRIRRFYAKLDSSRETVQLVKDAHLDKEKIEVRLFTPEKLEPILGVRLTDLEKAKFDYLERNPGMFPDAEVKSEKKLPKVVTEKKDGE